MKSFSGKPPHGGSGKRGQGTGRSGHAQGQGRSGPNRDDARPGGGRDGGREGSMRSFGTPRGPGAQGPKVREFGGGAPRRDSAEAPRRERDYTNDRDAGARTPRLKEFGAGPRRDHGDAPRAERSFDGDRPRNPRQGGDERRPAPRRDYSDAPRPEYAPRLQEFGGEERRPARRGPHGEHAPRVVPQGSGLWLYGLHAVEAALRNPNRRLRRLVVTQDAEAALSARLPQPWNIAPEQVERAQIERLLGHDAVHQGAALLADPLPTPTLQSMLERPGPVLVLDQVTDPRNIGAILRSAAAFGAAGVIVQERNAPDETGALAKAASGALETVPLLRAVNLARTLVALKAADVWTVGLAAGGGMLSGPSFAGRRVALVMGAEGDGLRRLTRETCDEIAGLPMPGGFESLNVSAATAVALYEVTRS